MGQKYYLHYTEGCSPKVKAFNTELGLRRFLQSFIKKYGSLDDQGDNWVEVDKVYFGSKVEIAQRVVARKVRK